MLDSGRVQEFAMNSEGRVPQPDIAVVPIASSSDKLWYAESRRCDKRTVSTAGEQL